MNKYNNSIAYDTMKFIRKKRDESGLTFIQMAKKLNTSKANVSNWINGASSPRLQHLADILVVLETDFGELHEYLSTMHNK